MGILGIPFRDVVVCGMTGPGHCGEGWVFVLLQSGSQSGRPERWYRIPSPPPQSPWGLISED